MPESAFMTKRQAADEFQVSVTTIGNWIKDERLRAIKIGGVVRIPRAELHRLAGRCENGNQPR